MYIDSHCHLTHEKIQPLGGPERIVANAKAAGVDGMLNICCRISDEFPQVLETAQKFDNVWCTIGTHPHDAGDPAEMAITAAELAELAMGDPKIVGIGETGLDFYYKRSSGADQESSFRKHLQACVETGLPVIIHARDADEDMIRILREAGAGGKLRGVLHCFSSGPKLAGEAINLDFYISFSGILTFANAASLREIARAVPPERLLVETDAPYLAPEPHRGKVNEPALVRHTGKVLAEIHGMSEEDLASITKNNFFDLFTKAKKI